MEKNLTAYGKVNLVLNVLSVENGLHVLDTVILPTEFGDDVTVAVRNDNQIICRMLNHAEIPQNTAAMMARAVQKKYGTKGMDIAILKRIPEGAGLGGSSADAAAVARAAAELFSLEKLSGEFLSAVGSDVPAQYAEQPTRLVGTGKEAEVLQGFPYLYAYILAGGGATKTQEVFRRFDGIGGDTGDVGKVIAGVMAGRDEVLFNALERAADVGTKETKISLLKEAGFSMFGMSGSGSAYVGYSYQPISGQKLSALYTGAQASGLSLITTKTLKG